MNDFIFDIVSHLSSLLQGSTIWTAGASVRDFGASWLNCHLLCRAALSYIFYIYWLTLCVSIGLQT